MCQTADRRFDLVTTDVDGTLLSSKNELSPRNEEAIAECIKLGVPVCIATGKARGPWCKKVLPKLGTPMPGVYMQGLLIYNADGSIMHEESLLEDIVKETIILAKELDITLAMYTYERILVEQTNADSDRLLPYEDPTPETIGDLEQVVGKLPIQKCIMIASEERIAETREQIAERLGDGTRTSLTVAIAGMLEILPAGASKGKGVKQLLKHLDVKAERVLAMGDGENDKVMLQMVGLGVAMGNASKACLEAADVQVSSNDNDGVAEALEKYILEPAGVKLTAPKSSSATQPLPKP